MRQILIVEDDVPIGDMLEEVLGRAGYRTARAYSGTEAVLALERERPDLALLDLMLPGLSGREVLQRFAGVPVIVVSARTDVDSKVALLLKGAVDYVTKPFDTRELLARIQVALRGSAPAGGTLAWRDLRLEESTRQVWAGGRPVKLTRTEYAILHLLMRSPGQVTTRSVLLERIAVDTPDCTEASLKTHVSNLRKKLRQAGGRDYIESVWGIGFKLREEI